MEPTGSLITFYDEGSTTLTVRSTSSSDGAEIDVFDCLLRALNAPDEVMEEFWSKTVQFDGSHTVTLDGGIEGYWRLEDTFLAYFAPVD